MADVKRRRTSLADEAGAALTKTLPADAQRIKSLTCQLALAAVLNLTFIAVFLFFLRETYISKTTTKFLSLDRVCFFCSVIEICLNLPVGVLLLVCAINYSSIREQGTAFMCQSQPLITFCWIKSC